MSIFYIVFLLVAAYAAGRLGYIVITDQMNKIDRRFVAAILWYLAFIWVVRVFTG